MQFYNERAFGVGHRMQTHTQACSKRKPPALAAGGLTTARFNEDQLEPLKSTLAKWRWTWCPSVIGLRLRRTTPL